MMGTAEVQAGCRPFTRDPDASFKRIEDCGREGHDLSGRGEGLPQADG